MASTAKELLLRIRRATEQLDRGAARQAAEETAEIVNESARAGQSFPTGIAVEILAALRRKRYFEEMELVSDALLENGNTELAVQRQYVQALIDSGKLSVARGEVDELIESSVSNEKEHAEARGLRGRILKQSYVNAGPNPSRAARQDLSRAIRQYGTVYDENPRKHYWHGINVVACVDRALRDGVDVGDNADKSAIATDILNYVSSLSQRNDNNTWAWATALEASVALNDMEAAGHWLELYIQSEYADAFELSATYRQLTEVWQLRPDGPWGFLLSSLQGALLLSAGGHVLVTEGEILGPDSSSNPEAIWGPHSVQTVDWIEELLRKITAVVRVERTNSVAVGSGFIVNGKELHERWRGLKLLVTNAHVVDDPAHELGITPNKARVNLTRHRSSDDRVRIDQLWSSSFGDLDISIHALRNPPDNVETLELGLLEDIQPSGTEETARLIVAGHPGGGDLTTTLQNNHLTKIESPVVYYNSPTLPGSSGSPVLTDEFAVVAIHRAENPDVRANEGVLTEALRERLAENPPAA